MMQGLRDRLRLSLFLCSSLSRWSPQQHLFLCCRENCPVNSHQHWPSLQTAERVTAHILPSLWRPFVSEMTPLKISLAALNKTCLVFVFKVGWIFFVFVGWKVEDEVRTTCSDTFIYILIWRGQNILPKVIISEIRLRFLKCCPIYYYCLSIFICFSNISNTL